jgi:hypothetical protein
LALVERLKQEGALSYGKKKKKKNQGVNVPRAVLFFFSLVNRSLWKGLQSALGSVVLASVEY